MDWLSGECINAEIDINFSTHGRFEPRRISVAVHTCAKNVHEIRTDIQRHSLKSLYQSLLFIYAFLFYAIYLASPFVIPDSIFTFANVSCIINVTVINTFIFFSPLIVCFSNWKWEDNKKHSFIQRLKAEWKSAFVLLYKILEESEKIQKQTLLHMFRFIFLLFSVLCRCAANDPFECSNVIADLVVSDQSGNLWDGQIAVKEGNTGLDTVIS